MIGREKYDYTFGSFRLNQDERQLFRDGSPVRLTPKSFEVLVCLVENAGHLLAKEDLMRAVWPDTFVEEANLARIIHTLRRVLGEDDNGNKFIETVSRKGYRFVARTCQVDGNSSDQIAVPAPDAEPKTYPARSSIHDARSLSRPMISLIIGLLLLSGGGLWAIRRTDVTSIKSDVGPTGHGEALQHYRLGKLYLDRKLKGDEKLALDEFEKAIELDPNYAAAYAGKADVRIWMFWGSEHSHDDIIQARTAVTTAIGLDQSSSYAHTIMCRLMVTYDWNFDGGERECRRAVELDGNSADAHSEWALYLNVLGREEEALAEIDKAITLSPTSFNKRSRGLILYYSRRYDEAIVQLKQVEETDPAFPMASKWMMRAYEMKNDYSHALECRLRQLELSRSPAEEVNAVRDAYASDGWPAVLRSMINSVKPRGREFGYTETAAMYAQLGDVDRAFESLNRACDSHEVSVPLIRREPRLSKISTDPRFSELLHRVRLN